MANQLKMATIDAILSLYQRNWSIRRIAKELGLNRGSVSRHIRLHELTAKRAILPEGAHEAKQATPEEGAHEVKQATPRGEKGSGVIILLLSSSSWAGPRAVTTGTSWHGGSSTMRQVVVKRKRLPTLFPGLTRSQQETLARLLLLFLDFLSY